MLICRILNMNNYRSPNFFIEYCVEDDSLSIRSHDDGDLLLKFTADSRVVFCLGNEIYIPYKTMFSFDPEVCRIKITPIVDIPGITETVVCEHKIVDTVYESEYIEMELRLAEQLLQEGGNFHKVKELAIRPTKPVKE